MKLSVIVLGICLLCCGCFDKVGANDLPPGFKLQTTGSEWRWVKENAIGGWKDFEDINDYDSREECVEAVWGFYRIDHPVEKNWKDEEPAWKDEAACRAPKRYSVAFNCGKYRFKDPAIGFSHPYNSYYEAVAGACIYCLTKDSKVRSDLLDEDFTPKWTWEWPNNWKVVTAPVNDCGCP